MAINNTADKSGGFYLGKAVNCSVIKNKSNAAGAATYNTELINTVVYGNRDINDNIANIFNDAGKTEKYVACENELRAGEGNISLSLNNEGDANSPYFKYLSEEAGAVDEQFLSNVEIDNVLSALIDAGDNTENTSGYEAIYDNKRNKRRDDTTGLIDIGAFEFQK